MKSLFQKIRGKPHRERRTQLKPLVEMSGYLPSGNRMVEGSCPHCGKGILVPHGGSAQCRQCGATVPYDALRYTTLGEAKEGGYEVKFGRSDHEALASVAGGSRDPVRALVSRTTGRRKTVASREEIDAAINALRSSGDYEHEDLADALQGMLEESVPGDIKGMEPERPELDQLPVKSPTDRESEDEKKPGKPLGMSDSSVKPKDYDPGQDVDHSDQPILPPSLHEVHLKRLRSGEVAVLFGPSEKSDIDKLLSTAKLSPSRSQTGIPVFPAEAEPHILAALKRGGYKAHVKEATEQDLQEFGDPPGYAGARFMGVRRPGKGKMTPEQQQELALRLSSVEVVVLVLKAGLKGHAHQRELDTRRITLPPEVKKKAEQSLLGRKLLKKAGRNTAITDDGRKVADILNGGALSGLRALKQFHGTVFESADLDEGRRDPATPESLARAAEMGRRDAVLAKKQGYVDVMTTTKGLSKKERLAYFKALNGLTEALENGEATVVEEEVEVPELDEATLADAAKLDERTLEVEYLGMVKEPGGKMGVAITINGQQYHYTPTATNAPAAVARSQAGGVSRLGKKFKKLLALSPGKALAWLKRNAVAYAGTKANPLGDHNRGHLLPDPGKKLKRSKEY